MCNNEVDNLFGWIIGVRKMKYYGLLCIALLLVAVPANATIVVDNWNTKLCELAMAGPGHANDEPTSFNLAAFEDQALSGSMLDSDGNMLPNFADTDSLGNDAFGSVSGVPTGFELAEIQSQINCAGQEEDSFCLGVLPEPSSIIVWGLLGTGCAGGALASRRRRRAPWSDETRQSIHQIIERGRISS